MSKRTLGALQHAIMQVLWTRGEATSADVHAALLPDRGLAPTTIATMLRKMEDKGVVSHRREGRVFVFQATVSEHEVKRSMVDEIVDRLFSGDPAALVSHLISDRPIDHEEVARLRSLLDELNNGEED